ncbi:MAG: hypothetical protein M1133_04680, partial [Armatimonadetes bacterium]|nr:hypothetical protein [Armatimonadota bacterium]
MKYGGLDVHKSFIQVCILDRELESCDDFRIDSSRESLRELEQLLSETECVALEASSHWGWVVDELDGMGLDVVLSHPSKTKAICYCRAILSPLLLSENVPLMCFHAIFVAPITPPGFALLDDPLA